ncbi:alanine racemase [Actinoallomurus iriomotensis]|uniref:Alanine racemase n=1 Tax=Actinoallomurus iriomotensis TaxID=478107 RepID=A0A9W6SA11_9ACTN|nr:alanine racemase [Actinoallomurus iriomotensis]GLY91181.1 alanine racemase [Actinoallomurus iriomotensis]
MSVTTAARVDLVAIRRNVELLRESAPGAELMAVVKADGYGHGIIPAARAAVAGGASWLGVATLDEALTLRRAGLDVRVMCWLYAPGERFDDAVAEDVDLSATSVGQVEEITRAAARVGRQVRLHLKTDTGLARSGATPADWPALVDAALRAQAEGLATVVGLWSHMACADEPGHPSIAAQLREFDEAVELAEKAGARPEVRHIANSAATLTLPEARYDLVRPGIAVYGLDPIPSLGPARRLGLRPAMTLTGRLALAKRVGAGQGVSYGHRYTTSAETTLGLVPLGYADGIPRHGTNLLEVWAAGRRRRVAGTVCMDQFVIDVGDDEIRAGDEVILFGPGDRGEPTAQDWAEMLGTISYEIVTRIGARVPRTYAEEAV